MTGKGGVSPSDTFDATIHGDTETGLHPVLVAHDIDWQGSSVAPIRTLMNKAKLARTIADSLVLGPWSAADVMAVLQRRLPRATKTQLATLSRDIVGPSPALYAPSVAVVAKALMASAGFAPVFSHCQKHNVWPVPELGLPTMAPTPAFARLDLPQLTTPAALADWLLIAPDRLRYLADPTSRHEQHGETAVNHYHYLWRPKKAGRMRLIEAPKPALKSLQRLILTGLLDHVPPHPDSFGFVKGRNCLQGANRHTAEEVLVCFDLQNFFASIAKGRVFGLFRCLGYPAAVAHSLAAICTTQTPPRVLERLTRDDRWAFEEAHLPQGSPASPALANLMAHGLDCRLSGLAQQLGAHYSRYADDLAFSGDRHIAGLLTKAVPAIIRDEGFRVQPRKTRILPRTTAQRVTGIGVNAHLNLPRPVFDQLKAVIHATDTARFTDPRFRAQLMGRIAWAETVNPSRGLKLRNLLAKRLAASG